MKLISMLNSRHSSKVAPYPLLTYTETVSTPDIFTVGPIIEYHPNVISNTLLTSHSNRKTFVESEHSSLECCYWDSDTTTEFTAHIANKSNEIEISTCSTFQPVHQSTALERQPTTDTVNTESNITSDHYTTVIHKLPISDEIKAANILSHPDDVATPTKRYSVKLLRRKSRMLKAQLIRGETFLRKMCKPRALPPPPASFCHNDTTRTLPNVPMSSSTAPKLI